MGIFEAVKKQISYWLGEVPYSVAAEGEWRYGENEVLLDQDEDLTAGCAWAEAGFTVARLFEESPLYERLRAGLLQFIGAQLQEVLPSWPGDFVPEHYHHFVDDAQHAAFIRNIRGCFDTALFPIALSALEARISVICGRQLSVMNPATGISEFCLRIVRPQAPADNNPPHRDIYLDHLRNGINLYIPLAGSNAHSALPILPGSHHLPEHLILRSAPGVQVNGLSFSVPCIADAPGGLHMIRPNPGPNEVLVFSPYLIHGGGANLNEDLTRISLEMRLFRKTG